MNAETPEGSARLLGAVRPVASKPGLVARAWSGGLARLVDRIDAGIEAGTMHATLPDGTTRVLGGRGPGIDCELTLHDWRGLLRLATAGSQGWYQAWEAGEWSSPDEVSVFAHFGANARTLGDAGRAKGPWRAAARALHWLNRNTRGGSAKNIHAHYDLGNAFYAAWLDRTMSYSSALFDTVEMRGPARLALGQERKMARMAERVGGAGSVLEIGCGWGAMAQTLSERGCAVTAISLSDEQLAYARAHRDGSIDFRKQDYRDVAGQFDGIVSVEMVEAVGREFWPEWFACIARNLKPGGRAAIQYIAMQDDLFDAYASSADFIQAYIFPGGMLVRESEFRQLAAEHGLAWQDREEFSLDYAETLAIWRANFDAAWKEGRIPEGFDERFARLWRFYLMYCEGGFRGGSIFVAQVTLVKEE